MAGRPTVWGPESSEQLGHEGENIIMHFVSAGMHLVDLQ